MNNDTDANSGTSDDGSRDGGTNADGWKSVVKRADTAIDSWFTPLRGRHQVDRVFYLASEGADFSKAWHAINLLMALALPSRRRHALRLAVSLGIESAFVNGLLKNVFVRERPDVLPNAAFDVRRPKTKSFPSGHASSACLTAVLLTDAMPRGKRLWWLLAAVVSASRVHNRMHHASDVAAGAAVGTVMGRAIKKLFPLP